MLSESYGVKEWSCITSLRSDITYPNRKSNRFLSDFILYNWYIAVTAYVIDVRTLHANILCFMTASRYIVSIFVASRPHSISSPRIVLFRLCVRTSQRKFSSAFLPFRLPPKVEWVICQSSFFSPYQTLSFLSFLIADVALKRSVWAGRANLTWSV